MPTFEVFPSPLPHARSTRTLSRGIAQSIPGSCAGQLGCGSCTEAPAPRFKHQRFGYLVSDLDLSEDPFLGSVLEKREGAGSIFGADRVCWLPRPSVNSRSHEPRGGGSSPHANGVCTSVHVNQALARGA